MYSIYEGFESRGESVTCEWVEGWAHVYSRAWSRAKSGQFEVEGVWDDFSCNIVCFGLLTL